MFYLLDSMLLWGHTLKGVGDPVAAVARPRRTQLAGLFLPAGFIRERQPSSLMGMDGGHSRRATRRSRSAHDLEYVDRERGKAQCEPYRYFKWF
jgi:hypothetical protein